MKALGLTRGIIGVSTANGLGSLMTVGALVIATRGLGPEVWGFSAAAWAAGQFFGGLVNFGVSTERIRSLAGMSEAEASQAFGSVVAARLLLLLLLILAGVILLAAGANFLALVLFAAAGSSASLLSTAHAYARRNYRAATVILGGEKGIFLLIVASASFTESLTVHTVPVAAGMAGVIMLISVLVVHKPGSSWSGFQEVWRQYRRSANFGWASLGPSILLLDVLVVGLFASETQAGFFAVASRLTSPLSLLTTAAATALLPVAASITSWESLRLGSRGAAVLSVFGFGLVSLALLAPLWVPRAFGSPFEGAIPAIQIYLANAAVIVVTRISVTLLQGWNQERFAAQAVMFQCLATLLLVAVGAYVAGAIGAAVAVLWSNIILSCILVRKARQTLALRAKSAP
ncbi:hypothetical protein GCM10009821_27150 [Aeromicrobium halocynthiae]|uniref:Polysaccharide biosynthesis protein C-terminal domain-containing protein n=1 Tax=Aeromicrobium halocynthiae TaxID=560557 RepID=A0ABP5HT78_9ACTN